MHIHTLYFKFDNVTAVTLNLDTNCVKKDLPERYHKLWHKVTCFYKSSESFLFHNLILRDDGISR